MKISVESYGVTEDGRQVLLYSLENRTGMRADIINYGACLLRLFVPDKQGKLEDVVLGHPSIRQYEKNREYFGAVVGRNCNRIADAQLELAGVTHKLEANNGSSNLHSGSGGLSFRLFNAEARIDNGHPMLLLTHTIESGGDGFPGNLTVSVAYTLTDDNALLIDYRGISDADTVINLTNHSYFNLTGHGSGNIYGHQLQMNASFYCPVDSSTLPTGEILSVDGPFDFRKGALLGNAVSADVPQVKQCGGIDHNMVLGGQGYRNVATVTEPVSGRIMSVFTNLPGVQLYTGNHIAPGTQGKDGATYDSHGGFCLETQFFPNAVAMPWLLSPIFRAGEEYITSTGFHFGTL